MHALPRNDHKNKVSSHFGSSGFSRRGSFCLQSSNKFSLLSGAGSWKKNFEKFSKRMFEKKRYENTDHNNSTKNVRKMFEKEKI